MFRQISQSEWARRAFLATSSVGLLFSGGMFVYEIIHGSQESKKEVDAWSTQVEEHRLERMTQRAEEEATEQYTDMLTATEQAILDLTPSPTPTITLTPTIVAKSSKCREVKINFTG